MTDTFKTQGQLQVGKESYEIFSLAKLAQQHPEVAKLPYSLKVLLENLLRYEDGRVVRSEHVQKLLAWNPKAEPDTEISFHPARVLLQDFTGVPAVVDLASMREALAKMGGNPDRMNPLFPADLVIDHSVQVDSFASTKAVDENQKLEYERNNERYQFLRWGQQAFKNFRVVPPNTGICHQVNLEFLAPVVFQEGKRAYPDTLVGTDSHTTMINGLGVVGWGVGGIEAEAALLGQPITMLIPQVVGFRLKGKLPPGATATDLVLTCTQMLRKRGVVGKFVEFFGSGLGTLSLPDRATIANMAPEYGATIGFFPVDAEALAYMRFTGRSEAQVALAEAYCKEQGLFSTPDAPEAQYTDVLELDLASVVPSLAGPKRPQDRVPLSEMQGSYQKQLIEMLRGAGPRGEEDGPSSPNLKPGSVANEPPVKDLARIGASVDVSQGVMSYRLGHGAVVIAAITSCTNTSNPAVLIAAGLLAKNAVERGIDAKPWVKTSLAPGSRVVTEYLKEANLLPYLEALGFHVVGYGCTTCIGNSGPLPEQISDAVVKGDLVVAAVLSGNRNFEGRINAHVRMNYLASPPLVVAYALAGTVDIDPDKQPLAHDRNGNPVYLRDIWPTDEQVRDYIRSAVKPDQFRNQYAHAMDGDEHWQKLAAPKGSVFTWDPKSTYVRRPTFFDDIPKIPHPLKDISGARVLALLGDSVTTDHISPAGNIAKNSPAAKYLMENGVEPKDFNSYGSRRGNHEVMMRGTFANIRIKNLLIPGVEGGVTVHLPTSERMSIYDASIKYQADKTPLVVLAGAEYGTGSSRDWAAKGTMMLGIKAVIAKSFERIHRSNLVGMGVLPLQFEAGSDAASLGLTGHETFEISGIAEGLAPGAKLKVKAIAEGGAIKEFTATCRIDTPNEFDYYRHGGILHYVLRGMAAKA
ncbi:MAG: aconitate hydratase AcnA [Myxococcota bacterium]|nr:aconitate hydratase AcnA [Myxococcota bacterium]